jgi:hypothetical protein
MNITPEILAEAGEMLKGHLKDYQNDIDQAFSNFEEKLTVNFMAKLGVDKGKIKIETGISFPVEKVKDADTKYFDPDQRELFGKEDEKKDIF